MEKLTLIKVGGKIVEEEETKTTDSYDKDILKR